MIDLAKLKAYIDARVAYEVASAISSHEHCLHDYGEDSCRPEWNALEKAEADLISEMGK